MRRLLIIVIAGLLGLAIQIGAAEPSRTPIMEGAPPGKEGQVTFNNYRHYPSSKWAFHNRSAPLNMLAIPREGQVTELGEKDNAELGQQLTS